MAGHSSFFLQLGGRRILIDPVFSDYASLVFFINKAFPGSNVYTADDMPEIDVLDISHDHWDHLDYPSVMALKPKIKHIVCPLGVGEHFEAWGFDMSIMREEDWDTEIRLGENGQYNMAWHAIHMLPEETAQAASDVRAKLLLPAHGGKFALSRHPWQEPYRELSRFSQGRGYKLLTPEIGEAAYLDSDRAQNFGPWWEKMK